MANYTPTQITTTNQGGGTSTGGGSLGNTGVVVIPTSGLTLTEFTQAVATEGVYLTEFNVLSNDTAQLIQPLGIAIGNVNGSLSKTYICPVLDSYQVQNQVTFNVQKAAQEMGFAGGFKFDGLNQIDYPITAKSVAQVTMGLAQNPPALPTQGMEEVIKEYMFRVGVINDTQNRWIDNNELREFGEEFEPNPYRRAAVGLKKTYKKLMGFQDDLREPEEIEQLDDDTFEEMDTYLRVLEEKKRLKKEAQEKAKKAKDENK